MSKIYNMRKKPVMKKKPYDYSKRYYQVHKHLWRRGGKYYHYKPPLTEGKFSTSRGVFLINFD